jgi:hypothetical protein
VAPEIGPPDESVTVPNTLPVSTWALSGVNASNATTKPANKAKEPRRIDIETAFRIMSCLLNTTMPIRAQIDKRGIAPTPGGDQTAQ